jgi:hypothetical protein
LLGLAFLSVASSGSTQAATPIQTEESCFDAAILAGPPNETMVEGSSDPRDVIGHPLWKLQIKVDRVLLGQIAQPTVQATERKHVEYNPAIREHLFLLRARPDGSYDVVGGDYRVIRDTSGRFVIPLANPLSDDWLYPSGPIPKSYRTLLKPVQYAPKDAWWLDDAADWQLEELDPKWARHSGRTIVALRGLYLDDWAQAIRSEQGALCAHP